MNQYKWKICFHFKQLLSSWFIFNYGNLFLLAELLNFVQRKWSYTIKETSKIASKSSWDSRFIVNKIVGLNYPKYGQYRFMNKATAVWSHNLNLVAINLMLTRIGYSNTFAEMSAQFRVHGYYKKRRLSICIEISLNLSF